jgi:hypothetical protein
VNAFLRRLTAIGALAVLPAYVHAECRAQSPPQAVALIELYTSEGCDSCPPADRWLSQLEARADRVVPLGLHVDYWDRLGWKDRFASAAFTQRQYEQMRRQRGAFVYTPQILLQGRDFSQWRTQADAAAAIAAVNARQARATIELAAQSEGGKVRVDMHVSVPDAAERGRARVAVALVQDHLVSEVKAGENAGKRLSHDHVVRQWAAGMPVASDGELRDRLTFALPSETGPIALAAFVEDSTSGEVLQAFALPLCSTP